MSSPFPPPSDPRREPSWDDVTWPPPNEPVARSHSRSTDSPTPTGGAHPASTPPTEAWPPAPRPATTHAASTFSPPTTPPELRDGGRRVREVRTGRLLLGITALLVAIFTAGPAITGTPWLPHLSGSGWLVVVGAACVLLGLLGLLAGALSRRHR